MRRAAAWALALALCSCGAEAADAPPEPPVAAPCPPLDEALAGTLTASRSGAVDPLGAVLAEYARGDDDPIGRWLSLALSLLQEFLPSLSPWDGAPTLPAGLGASLGGALRGFVALPAEDPAALDRVLVFDALAEALRVCPDGSWTAAARLVLEDEALVEALIATLRAPEVFAVLAPLLTPEAGEVGRSSMETLLRLVVDELLREDFDAEALARAARAFLPVNEEPLRGLIAALGEALQGDGLAVAQAPLRCLQGVTRARGDGQARDGIALLGGALYDGISAEGFAAAPLLAALPAEGAEGGLLGLLRAALARWEADPALRAQVGELLDFALRAPRARGALEGAAALLEAGALEELVALAGQLAGGCAP